MARGALLTMLVAHSHAAGSPIQWSDVSPERLRLAAIVTSMTCGIVASLLILDALRTPDTRWRAVELGLASLLVLISLAGVWVLAGC